jgi:hypothetical protein
MTDVSNNPAVIVAKEQKDGAGLHVTRTGYKVRIQPFPEMLARQAVMAVKDPPVPVYWNADKEREEPNPNDPDYLNAKAEAEAKRGEAGIDAALLFGVELVSPLPSDERWLKKLGMLGIHVDPTDSLAVELAFLKYIVFSSSEDISALTGQVSVTERGIAEAAATFPGDAAGDTD